MQPRQSELKKVLQFYCFESLDAGELLIVFVLLVSGLLLFFHSFCPLFFHFFLFFL